MTQAPSDDLRCLVIFILWEIWKARNFTIRGEPVSLSPVSSILLEQPPSFELPQLFIDRAFRSSTVAHGGGWVLCHSNRSLLLQGSSRFNASSALEVETRTCWLALMVVLEQGFDRLILFSDCQTLVQTFLDSTQTPQEVASLFYDIRILRCMFRSLCVVKTSRSQVNAAHILAQRVCVASVV
ncbi:OLC1v1015763C1 [Oldenlandia corymbosa var. corymbosa]|uniref:OLC1v1015763C1 n=1 Tax=Oldenlandia corymbosa var. corymbosa TaxID=529605 RepID=A0AAV1E3W1_OLDCO|nr:OLC1v1015763C1 [Oldenlandia corymbosa var. corymbosa]